MAGAAWRRDEIISRRNARHDPRIAAERAALQPLPERRVCDYEKAIVDLTTHGGFSLKKVFYTVPSRLIGQNLRVKLYHNRFSLYIGCEPLITLRL